ncbi:MAG: hypothetical protein IJ706_06165, partial [Clostridia bacterium]|nr:hypothetical protein [Clostridia bacterium]
EILPCAHYVRLVRMTKERNNDRLIRMKKTVTRNGKNSQFELQKEIKTVIQNDKRQKDRLIRITKTVTRNGKKKKR